jgi:glycosyltransferase involved in cell wall biosynthesis
MTRIAILIPCYNEAITIRKVVNDFRRAIPEAEIHVFDNNSQDGTAAEAQSAGAIVHSVPIQGKGAVVRQMFRVIDADVGVMVDGDDTYPADKVRDILQPVLDGRADMVVGTRLQQHADQSFRPLHVFGNQLVLNSINTLFAARLSDVLSGYRAFSWRFMKTTPVLSRGFEIETEMTLHALDHQLPVVEVPVPYGVRPEGSESKLHTFRDGYRVLKMILWLFKDYRPLLFFGAVGLVMLMASIFIGFFIIDEWLRLGRAAPARAILAVALGLIGVLSIATGLTLDTVNRRTRELMVLITDQLVERARRRS